MIASELAEDSRFRERFLRESRVAASLDHPHIVPDLPGRGRGRRPVHRDALRRGHRPRAAHLDGRGARPRRAISLLEQVAEALDAAHEKGLVHRDVKPSNVLIAVAAGKEHCYLADFGLTKRTGSLSGVSAPGDVVGTLEYVAPEQITGEDVDARADVYSLACVLYECLTGQSPFPRATDVALALGARARGATAAELVRPELPQPLDAVLGHALAKEPDRPLRDGGELRAARSRSASSRHAPAPTDKRLQWVFGAAVLALARQRRWVPPHARLRAAGPPSRRTPSA